MEKHIDNKPIIARKAGTPLYVQVRDAIEEGIRNGTIAPDENGCLPTQQFFADKFNVAVLTVKRAIQGLELNGMVESRRGKGLVLLNREARSFVAGNSGDARPSIGFFFLHEGVDRMSRVAEYIQRACDKHNYDLKVISFGTDYYDTTDLLQDVKSRGLTGAIMVPLDRESCWKGIRLLEEAHFPVVRLGNDYFEGKLKSTMVVGNDAKSCRDAMDYLWKLGHRKIGLITSFKGSSVEMEYWRYYAQHGMAEERWQVLVPFRRDEKNWREANLAWICDKYLEENMDVTAIMVWNPTVCRDVLFKAQAMGRSVPDELSLIALSDDRMGLDIMNPPITSMMLYEKAMGENACDALFKIITHGFPDTGQRIELDYDLNERCSVASI